MVLRCCSNSATESGTSSILLKDSANGPAVVLRKDHEAKKRNLTPYSLLCRAPMCHPSVIDATLQHYHSPSTMTGRHRLVPAPRGPTPPLYFHAPSASSTTCTPMSPGCFKSCFDPKRTSIYCRVQTCAIVRRL